MGFNSGFKGLKYERKKLKVKLVQTYVYVILIHKCAYKSNLHLILF